jgi:hypothetical protein
VNNIINKRGDKICGKKLAFAFSGRTVTKDIGFYDETAKVNGKCGNYKIKT